MVIYELTHMFFQCEGELIYSPKNLGVYYSYESAKQAVQYYRTLPGFCENQEAFSVKERCVLGNIIDDTVFEAIVYLHTKDYEFEIEIELGLYAEQVTAQNKLQKYCTENFLLVNAQNLVSEQIVNKCIIERKEWSEGFSISN